MDFAQLKRFIAVVEGGSLGKAAETLNLSQPGLSKSIGASFSAARTTCVAA